MANAATIEIARTVRQTFAAPSLTEQQAKLYSQRLRLNLGRQGLVSFSPNDVYQYLDEAALLIQCGLLERGANPNGSWRHGIKRAAEILEWLSQPGLGPEGAPLHLLAAAAYQMANFPAMALGHLRQVPDNENASQILREFLRADFPSTISAARKFWIDRRTRVANGDIVIDDIADRTIGHVVMCISTVCEFMRTGAAETERALDKLDRLARSLIHSCDPYSYLLAQLTAVSCRGFVETSLWPQIGRLSKNSSDSAGVALIQFARSAFINRRTLVWPAQAAGIDHLIENDSFVLCTPTGSGKNNGCDAGNHAGPIC